MNSPRPVPLRVPDFERDLQLYVHGEQDRVVSRQIRDEGIWEPYETSLLLQLLQPGDVFVDVGANIGYFSVLAGAVVGEAGAVYAFEPDPDNYRMLRANADLNGLQDCIHSVEAGLSDGAGEGRLFLSEDNLGDHRIFAAGGERDSLPIRLHDGSRYLADKVERVDLLKVDTQGSEYRVMAGLMPLLQQLPGPPHILIELTPHALRAAGASGRQLIELLANLQQPVWIVDHIGHHLMPSSCEALALWCDNWDKVPESRGFMNILLGPADRVADPSGAG